MHCRRTREHLGALVDGELPLALARATLKHLKGCAPCQAELHVLRSVGALLRDSQEAAPAGLGARILVEARESQVVREPQEFSFASIWPRAAAMFVGAATVVWLAAPLESEPFAAPAVPRSPFNLVALESQAELQLIGSFTSDLDLLARSPEGRLMFDLVQEAR